MMHFGLYSTMGITESWPLVTKETFWARSDIEWERDDAKFKEQYYALNRCFNPIRFNAAEIAKKAKDCGFRYVSFTTKHHDGFCLWDTKFTDYKTTDPSCPYSTNPNADMVKVLFDACRAEGLGISCYFSKADFHHEDYWENRGIGRYTDRWPTYDVRKNPEKWSRFREFTKNQILELIGNYGPIDMLWLDGAWFFERNCGCDLNMRDIVGQARKITPGLIVVDRASGDEFMNIRTPEQCVPERPLPYPWETCMTMADGWGYHYDDVYKSPRQLIHLFVDVVAKGGNLALNVGPMPDGRLPRPAVERMEAMGAWLRKNGEAIYGTRAVEPYALMQWRFTKGKDGRVFAIRLWNEAENPRTSLFLKLNSDLGKVASVTHLATGREMKFALTVGDYDSGITLDLPSDFVRDTYADAFELRFEPERRDHDVRTGVLFDGWYADPLICRYSDGYWIYPTVSDFLKETSIDAFHSKDLKGWTKHPRVLSVDSVSWARCFWAPHAVEKDGRYYLFFGANDPYPVDRKGGDYTPVKEAGLQKYGGIGVAVADRPEGPYSDLIGKPLVDQFWNKAQPIDQYVFDWKGDWYMVYGGWGRCTLVRLAPDFKSVIPWPDGSLWRDLTPPGYVEGPVMFERKGIWYFMYSSGSWTTDDYCIKYCTGLSPFGPFQYKGKVLGVQRPIATGAGHHSVLCLPGTDEWLICYHRRPIPNQGQNHRVVCLDRMNFNSDGSIQPIVMTDHEGKDATK